MSNIGYATKDKSSPLGPLTFERPETGVNDVRIDIKYCGICHSDVHQARNEWEDSPVLKTNYPCMPGHEIAGIVTEVGTDVTRFKVGDRVSVGCMIDSDGTCDACRAGMEQYCESGATFTYNALDEDSGEVTFGGYSDEIVVQEHFVLHIPDQISLQEAGPIACSGVTTWSALKHMGVAKGDKIGIAGIGGLGSMAIQLAKALGAEVTALTHDAEKRSAAKELGADHVLLMEDEAAVTKAAKSLDYVLSTIPTNFDMNPYLSLLKLDGNLTSVGMLEPLHNAQADMANISLSRNTIGGSMIGSIPETQEVFDFCAKYNIRPKIEVISAEDINAAFDNIVNNDVQFRYVLDNATLKELQPA